MKATLTELKTDAEWFLHCAHAGLMCSDPDIHGIVDKLKRVPMSELTQTQASFVAGAIWTLTLPRGVDRGDINAARSWVKQAIERFKNN